MHTEVQRGIYILGVSGGVDSVALLHMLAGDTSLNIVVAHVDHGIRVDSKDDAVLVRELAEQYGVPFELAELTLGPDASEEQARDARYGFLKIVKAKYDADGIITAHHKDDVLETAIINLSRGTGRHGLSSLGTATGLVRPILHATKNDLIEYAKLHGLKWNEDSTNTDTKYLRNHVRKNIIPQMSSAQKATMHGFLDTARQVNLRLNLELKEYLERKSYRRGGDVFGRNWFNRLPHSFACEITHHWLKERNIETNRKFVDTLVLRIKAAKTGSLLDIGAGQSLAITKRSIRLPSHN